MSKKVKMGTVRKKKSSSKKKTTKKLKSTALKKKVAKKKITKKSKPAPTKKKISKTYTSQKTTKKISATLKKALDRLQKISFEMEQSKNKRFVGSTNKKSVKASPKVSLETTKASTFNKLGRFIRTNKSLHSPVLIVSGEHSGDLLGAEVVHALHAQGVSSFFGTGGNAMRETGVEILEHINTMNVIGFVEAFRAYRRLKKLALHLSEEANKRKTRFAILIDYPGFNLRLAQMLKEKGIHVIYIVSPQLWAWNYKRINTIKEVVDLMLPLFPFEESMYIDAGIKAKSIGHPMIVRIPKKIRKEKPIDAPARKVKYTIGLIPGSRWGEVSRLLPDMLEATRLLRKRFGKIRFLLPCADAKLLPLIEELLEPYKDLGIEVYEDSTYQIMSSSDAIIIASGTATLETAYFQTPMVLLYKVGWLNLFLATMLMRVRFIGIVNILGRTQTIVELLQTEVTPENIFHEIEKILTNKSYKENMIQELTFVKRQLGSGQPAKKAATEIIDFLFTR